MEREDNEETEDSDEEEDTSRHSEDDENKPLKQSSTFLRNSRTSIEKKSTSSSSMNKISDKNGKVPRCKSSPNFTVKRPALTVAQKEFQYSYEEPLDPGIVDSAISSLRSKTKCTPQRIKKNLLLRIPILEWVYRYNLKRDLVGDLISGFTVAVMHIPQGMAYAVLAGLDPINGIYMAFFPVMAYAIFSTSRHCSFGTFAVVCIMVSKVVNEIANPVIPLGSSALGGSINGTSYTPVEVATIVSFAVAVWLLIFAIFQLGMLSVFLSDMLVSGFTTGAACHVFSSQVKHILGISIATYSGPFKLMKTWRDIFQNIGNSNPATVIISVICLTVLALNNELLKPRIKKYTKLLLPIELITVIISTVISKYNGLNDNYNVNIVGEIPTGLPKPVAPRFELYGDVLIDSLVIAIIAYTVSFSMSKIFAKKHDYTVNATQELIAQSMSNFVASVFSCAPICASLSRSLIQEDVGGNTQMASFVSCLILLLVLLYIGPFFETLPNSVLGSIIIVALKGMFMQVKDMTSMFKISKLDAALWVLTFLSVAIIDIDYGLFIGIFASLVILLFRNQNPKVVVLGRVQDTDIYLDKERYSSVQEIPGCKICKISGNLHFANQESLKSSLISSSGLDPRKILKHRRKEISKMRKSDLKLEILPTVDERRIRKRKLSTYSQQIVEDGSIISEKEDVGEDEVRLSQNHIDATQDLPKKLSVDIDPDPSRGSFSDSVITIPDIRYFILDVTCVSQMDVSAVRNLVQLNKDYEDAEIKLALAGLSEHILEAMRGCGSIKKLPETRLFHSTHDAVTTLLDPTSRSATPSEEECNL